MKIIELVAENVKRLKVARVRPDSALVEVTGKNGEGKSSLLDAILYAVAGKRALPREPLRRGAKHGSVRLDLGKFVVTRHFTEHDTSLVVESPAGARYPSPQALLDDLVGAISFDPLAFSRMSARQQYDELLKLVKLDVDVEELARLNAADYAARADVNKKVSELAGGVKTVVLPDDLPDQPPDVAALTRELQAAGEANADVERRRARREQVAAQAALKRAKAAELRAQAEETLKRLEEEAKALLAQARSEDEHLRTLARNTDVVADELEQKLLDAGPLPELVDTRTLVAAVDQARVVEAHCQRRSRRQQLEDALHEQQVLAGELTARMNLRTRQRAEALERAVLPVPGLTFGEGEVLLNDLPLAQASDAEQLRLSVSVAMAANPELRVLRVKDGSLLDQEGLELLRTLAETQDYQVWVERVDDSGLVGVVMVDGEARQTVKEKAS